jgi:hypothetical protein
VRRYTVEDAAPIYLARLSRLTNWRRYGAECFNDTGHRMLELCIDATYRDCITADGTDAARPVMAGYRAWQYAQKRAAL